MQLRNAHVAPHVVRAVHLRDQQGIGQRRQGRDLQVGQQHISGLGAAVHRAQLTNPAQLVQHFHHAVCMAQLNAQGLRQLVQAQTVRRSTVHGVQGAQGF